MDLSFNIEKRGSDPVIVVRSNEIDSSDNTLTNGIPAHNVYSNIKDMRFKNKILKTIRERIGSLRHKNMFELKFPELRGLGLHTVDFISDGQGRMNATMQLEEMLQKGGR
jgi:hypothetical protein